MNANSVTRIVLISWKMLKTKMAQVAGLEPATRRLTVACSTTELHLNTGEVELCGADFFVKKLCFQQAKFSFSPQTLRRIIHLIVRENYQIIDSAHRCDRGQSLGRRWCFQSSNRDFRRRSRLWCFAPGI